MKKRLAIVFLLCAIMVLYACGNSTGSSTSDGNSSEQDNSNSAKKPSTESSETEDDTTAIDMEYSMVFTVSGQQFEGNAIYNGELKNGEPNGNGSLYFNNNSGYEYSYEGEFKNGVPSGFGTEKTINGNMTILYTGQFDDFVANGYGIIEITSDGSTAVYEGNFTDGSYDPTPSQIFKYWGQEDIFGGYSVSDEISEFIDTSNDFFPVADPESLSDEILQEFEYRKFIKTRSQEEIGLVKVNLTATQVFEYDSFNGKITTILARDSEYNYYSLYYLDSVDVYEDDSFTAYAVPCASSGFDNIGGGTTNVIVMLCSYIE